MLNSKYIKVGWTRPKDSQGTRVERLPPKVFRVLKDHTHVLDIERRIDPYSSGADAFVWTDKGIHLFYLTPNDPPPDLVRQADPLHAKLNASLYWDVFFVSKTHHDRPRSCVPITSVGGEFAEEYNRMVSEYVLKVGE